MNFFALFLVHFLFGSSVVLCAGGKKISYTSNEEREMDLGRLKVMIDLIEESIEMGELVPDIVFPSEVVANLFVSFHTLYEFIYSDDHNGTFLQSSDETDIKVLVSMDTVWWSSLNPNEDLNLLMVAEILDRHLFVIMAVNKFPAWITFYNAFGRNIVHFMALSGNPDLIIGALTLKNHSGANFHCHSDNNWESKILLAWDMVDGARKTPVQYLCELGSDGAILDVITLDPAISRYIFQNGISFIQTLANSGRYELLLHLISKDPILAITQFSVHGTLVHFMARLWKKDNAALFIKTLWSLYPLTFVDGRSTLGFTPLELIPAANRSQFEPDTVHMVQIYTQMSVSKELFNFNNCSKKSVLLELQAQGVQDIDGAFARELGLFEKILILPVAAPLHEKILSGFVEGKRSDLIIDILKRFDFASNGFTVLSKAYIVAKDDPVVFDALVSNTFNFVYPMYDRVHIEPILGTLSPLNEESLAMTLIRTKSFGALEILIKYHPEVLHLLDVHLKTPISYAISCGSMDALVAIFRNPIGREMLEYIEADRQPLLLHPLARGMNDVIRFFLGNRFFDPYMILNQGYAVIHLAAKVAPFHTFKMMITEFGKSQIHLITSNLRTVLHLAFTNVDMTLDYFKYIYYLDPEMALKRDSYYWTPLEFANTFGYSRCRSCYKFLSEKVVKMSPSPAINETRALDPKELELIVDELIKDEENTKAMIASKKTAAKKKKRKKKVPSLKQTVDIEASVNDDERGIDVTKDRVVEEEQVIERGIDLTESSVISNEILCEKPFEEDLTSSVALIEEEAIDAAIKDLVIDDVVRENVAVIVEEAIHDASIKDDVKEAAVPVLKEAVSEASIKETVVDDVVNAAKEKRNRRKRRKDLSFKLIVKSKAPGKKSGREKELSEAELEVTEPSAIIEEIVCEKPIEEDLAAVVVGNNVAEISEEAIRESRTIPEFDNVAPIIHPAISRTPSPLSLEIQNGHPEDPNTGSFEIDSPVQDDSLYYNLAFSILSDFCMEASTLTDSLQALSCLTIDQTSVIQLLHEAALSMDASCISSCAYLIAQFVWSLQDSVAATNALIASLNHVNMDEIRTGQVWSFHSQSMNMMLWAHLVKNGLLPQQTAVSALHLSGMDAISRENQKKMIFNTHLFHS